MGGKFRQKEATKAKRSQVLLERKLIQNKRKHQRLLHLMHGGKDTGKGLEAEKRDDLGTCCLWNCV